MNQMNFNIALIGFMGSGKTTVGLALANALGFSFLDTDKEVERVYQCQIPHIFQRFGEYYFRGAETRIIENAASFQRMVIATGGGAVKNRTNMALLSESSRLVYLKTTPDQADQNTQKTDNRPLLEKPDRRKALETLFFQREPLYEKYAQKTVEVALKTVDEIVTEICDAWTGL